MNTKIRIQIAEIIVVMALGTSLLPAASQSEGDYTVNAITVNGTVTEPGDLTVQGEAHIGGSLDLGTTGNSTSAMLFHYSEVNADSSFSLAATQPATAFLWQDNAAGTMKNKMMLDGNNVLSLFDGNGAAGIVFNPNTGGITLAGTGSGITLSDGTVLSNAASLHSTALYDSGGNVAVSVGMDGKVQFPNGITLPGGTLGTAAFTDSTAYATSPQGAKADTALQPNGDGSGLSINGNLLSGMFPHPGTFVVPEYANDEYLLPGSFERYGDASTCNLLGYIPTGGLFAIKDGAGPSGSLMEFTGSTNPTPRVIYFGGIIGAGTASWASTPCLDTNARQLISGDGEALDWANRQLVGAWQVTGAITLSDGTILANATSLRQAALYDNAGSAVASVASDGSVNFNHGATINGNVEMAGKIKMLRQGDILMGEFGNTGD